MQVPDANDEIIKLDLSVPPPALPEEDTSEPLPPGVEFEEEYQPIVPSFSKEKKEPVIKLLPQSPVTIMDEPLPPGVKEQEDLENLTPIVKPTKSHRVKRKFTDSPAEVILNKILDNLDDIKNKSETECESSDLETLGAHENSQSDPIVTVIELESPASPDQDPVVDQQNQGANNLEVQEILEKIERDHLYPMKSKPIEESNGPDNFPQKCLKEDSSNLKEPAKTKVKASSSDDQKPINVEKSPRSPNPGGESVDHVPPPPTFKIQDEVIDLDSE